MYREVTMIEIREVLRLRGEGLPKKRIAAQLGLDPKTVRRYLSAAATAGIRMTPTISDEEVRQVLLALHPAGGRPRGDGWARCFEQRAAIERWLGDGLRLTKIRKLLGRHGVMIAYPTLHRFAVLELQFGKTATTIPVLDGEPGQELQVDTGWVGWLTLPDRKRRRFRAWIFTAVRSRHRFVYPTFEETTARAIEACEAAWDFFGGIFKVLIPDNTKAIIIKADPLAPRITPAFLEYAQARHFHIDPARVRHARDKGKLERWFRTVRGQLLPTLTDADTRDLDALNRRLWAWIEDEYHYAPHRGLAGATPIDRWAANAAHIQLPTSDLTEVFLFEEKRKVHQDRTVSLHGVVYEVDAALVGETVTLRYDPARAMRGVQVLFPGRAAETAKPVDAYANCFVRRDHGTKLLTPHTPASHPKPGLPLRALKEDF